MDAPKFTGSMTHNCLVVPLLLLELLLLLLLLGGRLAKPPIPTGDAEHTALSLTPPVSSCLPLQLLVLPMSLPRQVLTNASDRSTIPQPSKVSLL
jgi:hypothetical protein